MRKPSRLEELEKGKRFLVLNFVFSCSHKNTNPRSLHWYPLIRTAWRSFLAPKPRASRYASPMRKIECAGAANGTSVTATVMRCGNGIATPSSSEPCHR